MFLLYEFLNFFSGINSFQELFVDFFHSPEIGIISIVNHLNKLVYIYILLLSNIIIIFVIKIVAFVS
jgi:hypothetical protein